MIPKAGTCWQVIRFSYENRYTFYLFNRLPDYDVKNVEKVLGAHCLPLEGQSCTTKYQTVDRSGRSFVYGEMSCVAETPSRLPIQEVLVSLWLFRRCLIKTFGESALASMLPVTDASCSNLTLAVGLQ